MPKLVTWMNNQRVGELTKLANGAHTFKYAPEWLANRYARPLSLSLPLQRGNITSDAVFNFFDNLLPDSPIVRDRIVKRYHAKSRQPFDLLVRTGVEAKVNNNLSLWGNVGVQLGDKGYSDTQGMLGVKYSW